MTNKQWESIFRLLVGKYVHDETTKEALAKELAEFMEEYGE